MSIQSKYTSEEIEELLDQAGQVDDLKSELGNGNINQHVKYPFVISNENGGLRANRSTLSLANGVLTSTRASDTTSTSFGFFVLFPLISAGHKIYYRVSGVTASVSDFVNFRLYFNNASLETLSDLKFTTNSVNGIVSFEEDVRGIALYCSKGTSTSDYFTVTEAIQIIDLTAIFGAGYEPSLETFNAVYGPYMPFDYSIPNYTVGLLPEKALIQPLIKSVNDVAESTKSLIKSVNDVAEMLETTESVVLVLHDNGVLGNNNQCIFTTRENETNYGYTRVDGSVVFPVANQGTPPCANVDIDKTLSIVRTWVGRNNIVHQYDGSSYTGIFGANCVADENEKYQMDCSDFVCAVLLGITYENSRVVSGNNGANTPLYGVGISMPCLEESEKLYGGLYSWKMAQWFAECGRLYEIPKTASEVADMLTFGDILFFSDDNNRYYGIVHVVFVIGTINTPKSSYIIFAHSGFDDQSTAEPSGIYISSSTINDAFFNRCKVFARPSYRANANKANDQSILPLASNAYTYNCLFVPWAELTIDDSEYWNLPMGSIIYNPQHAATINYLPAIPGAMLTYTGNTSDGTYNYYVRVAEYDENMTLIRRPTSIASNGESRSITLNSNTKYIRMGIGLPRSASRNLYLSDTKAFSVRITPS